MSKLEFSTWEGNAVPNWAVFRERLEQGDARYASLRHIRQLEPWLDLPFEQALAKAQTELAGLSDAEAKPVYDALPLIRLRVLRELGITGTDQEVQRRIQELFVAYEQGGGSEEQRKLTLKYANAFQITGFIVATHPALVQKLTREGVAAQRAFTESVSSCMAPMVPLMKRSQAGSASPRNISDIEAIQVELLKLAQQPPDEFCRHMIADRIARSYYWLALNHALLGHSTESQSNFVLAAEWFDKAGDPGNATDCRRRANEVNLGQTVDLDKILRGSLEAMTTAGTGGDPLERAKSLTAATRAMNEAGDRFEATRLADQATVELKGLGLLDPQEVGTDAAVDSWISALPPELRGTSYYDAFFKVVECYMTIFMARANDLQAGQERSQQAFSLVMHLTEGIFPAAAREEEAARNAMNEEWSLYFPQPARQAIPEQTGSEGPQGTVSLQDKLRQFELDWTQLNDESDQREAGKPQDDLLERAMKLQKLAVELNIPLYDAKAKLARATILRNTSRPQEALPLLDEARTVVHSGALSSYGAFAGSAERGVYELILRQKVLACADAGDLESVSAACEEAIGAIESQRYRVNSPEQQSAFLSWRVDFYRMGVWAAWKLKHWAQLLERIELVKARSLVRSRLLPETPDLDVDKLRQEFREVCDQMQDQPAGEQLASLATRRRQIWDLMAIARARSRDAAEPRELTIENLKDAIGPDEAAIGYFWLAPGVVLAVVADRDDFYVERIVFTPEQLSQYQEFVEGVQALESYSDALDYYLSALGPILLPPAVREKVRGKRRLVISPHRTLHVFPFHAVPWDGQFLGQRFAVRYAPNLSSLLLPWRGGASNQVLVVGISEFKVPVFEKKPLPLAEKEAERIKQIYEERGARVRALIGAEATRKQFQALREELPNFRCLHLTTHGTSVFQGDTLDHPMESKLILRDGWLDGLELSDLRLQADLVVLSACNSGQRAVKGRGLAELPGDDVFGLQSALFSAGARSVLGALWPLKDEAACDLAARFHQHYAAGKPPDEALQAAVNDYLDQSPRRETYYWAAMFLNTLGGYSNSV
jgi:CHAT domain-containing protein